MWNKLPIPIRAILAGLVVAGVPTVIWAVLATVNLRATPRVPWSILVMAVVLWLYWRFLGATEFRREHRRAAALSPSTWRLTLVAGGAAIAAVWAAFAALRGVLNLAAPANDVAQFPLFTVFAAIVMGSTVAGIVEEVGFRGFMQLPLERAYGPATAIGVTGVIFTAVHLTHGRAVLPFLPFYLVAGIIYGVMTYMTGSILPSMALHIGGDILMFSLRFMAARQGVGGGPTTGAIAPLYAIASVALAAIGIAAFRFFARRAVPALGS